VMVEAVRPTVGNVLDLWDDMMRPFTGDEERVDDQGDNGEKSVGDNQEGMRQMGKERK